MKLKNRTTSEPFDLPGELTNAACVLIGNGHHALAEEISNVIPLARSELPQPLHAVFEDLLITCQWYEEDPEGDHPTTIRAFLDLIRKAAS